MDLPGKLRRLVAFLVAAALLSFGAAGEAHAHDTGEPHIHGAELPPPPEGYRESVRGQVLWVYPDQARDTVHELQATYDETWRAITRDLGGDIDGSLVIRVGRNPEEMRALAPVGHPPPDYATGVAYSFGVVLLTLTAPETWHRPDLKTVLAHELSHVAVRRAVQGRPLPRWFVEGLAIHHAGEYSIERTRVLWQATLQDRLRSLRELERRFPHHPREVGVAYAQAASLVSFLLDDEQGRAQFAELIRLLRDERSFESALVESYDLTIAGLEHEWLASVRSRFRTWPLILGGSTLWVLISVFVLFAWVRRKRRSKEKLDRWAEEEEAVDRAEAAAERRIDELDEDEREVIFVSGDPPQGREPEVPTVQHEGHDHTLH